MKTYVSTLSFTYHRDLVSLLFSHAALNYFKLTIIAINETWSLRFVNEFQMCRSRVIIKWQDLSRKYYIVAINAKSARWGTIMNSRVNSISVYFSSILIYFTKFVHFNCCKVLNDFGNTFLLCHTLRTSQTTFVGFRNHVLGVPIINSHPWISFPLLIRSILFRNHAQSTYKIMLCLITLPHVRNEISSCL